MFAPDQFELEKQGGVGKRCTPARHRRGWRRRKKASCAAVADQCSAGGAMGDASRAPETNRRLRRRSSAISEPNREAVADEKRVPSMDRHHR